MTLIQLVILLLVSGVGDKQPRVPRLWKTFVWMTRGRVAILFGELDFSTFTDRIVKLASRCYTETLPFKRTKPNLSWDLEISLTRKDHSVGLSQPTQTGWRELQVPRLFVSVAFGPSLC